MSDRHLLLSSAKTAVVVEAHKPNSRWRVAAFCFGLFVVLVGAANVTSRAAQALLGDNAGVFAFAPAVALSEPSVLSAFQAGAISTGTSTSAVATTTSIIPTRLKIPSIGVNANIEQVGKKADGTMGTPGNFVDVAWYALGSKPGDAGNAVIDGHVDNALTTAGVFEHLSDLTLGDSITVSDAQGHTLTYMVTQVQVYPVDQAPTATIFATTGPSQLVLITCQGDWIPAEKSFNDRLVVTAALVN